MERLSAAVAEHQQIITAAEARDAETVMNLIRQNLERTCNVIAPFHRSRVQGSTN